MNARCGVVEHTERCRDICHQSEGSRCNVGRRHYLEGGVCCGTCFGICEQCGAPIYIEELRLRPGVDEDGEATEIELCHCCSEATS
jgi:hypothetical protein